MSLKPFMPSYLEYLLGIGSLSTPARIWKPKYILQYKCKCGKIVRIASKTKWLGGYSTYFDRIKRKQLFLDNKCPRNSYKNPCHHKFVKTISKFEPPTRIDVNKGIIEVSKKHFERLTYGT